MHSYSLPKAFVWRRLHSLTGLWLVLYLFIHLLTNSQAALMFGDDGAGFIRSANSLEAMPYVHVLEIILLAIPFGIHTVWGIQRLWTGKFNSFETDGSQPSLGQYPRNHAYTWQRITSWILLVLITAHVIHMRFLDYPVSVQRGATKTFMTRVGDDPGIYTLAERLNVTLLDGNQVAKEMQAEPRNFTVQKENTPEDLLLAQKQKQNQDWIAALKSLPINANQYLATADNFGTIELLILRETFKIPYMLVLYTLLVLSACFHAFNGLWTAMITWGATLSPSSQRMMRKITNFFMCLVAFLGLAAIWGTYWINLKY